MLKEFLKELENQGYRVLDLERKCPDGIALKDGKIYAIEVLSWRYRQGQGWDLKKNAKNKEAIYDMFDGVLFKHFRQKRFLELEQSTRKYFQKSSPSRNSEKNNVLDQHIDGGDSF